MLEDSTYGEQFQRKLIGREPETTENDEDRPCFVDRKSWQLFWEGLKRAKHITYWCGVVDSLVALIKTAESLGMSTSLNEELGKKKPFSFG